MAAALFTRSPYGGLAVCVTTCEQRKVDARFPYARRVPTYGLRGSLRRPCATARDRSIGVCLYIVVPPESEFNSFQEAVRIAKSSDSKNIFPIINKVK